VGPDCGVVREAIGEPGRYGRRRSAHVGNREDVRWACRQIALPCRRPTSDIDLLEVAHGFRPRWSATEANEALRRALVDGHRLACEACIRDCLCDTTPVMADSRRRRTATELSRDGHMGRRLCLSRSL